MHLAFHLKKKENNEGKVQGVIGNQNTWGLDKKAKSITGTEQEQPVFKINWYHLFPDYK